MRSLLRRRDYQEVRTPLVLSEQLWHTSGHYDNYLENMFFTKLKLRDEKQKSVIHDNVQEERPMAVKPMNCPGHLLIYRGRLHSHNEFPLRIAEMGLVHRRELSGVRHGLFRVQAFTQDDAHHFCTPEQIQQEISMLIDFFKEVYGTFGLGDVRIELSTRPEKSIGSEEIWQRAEAALKGSLDASGISYQVNPGDGAFYGPEDRFSHSGRAQTVLAMRHHSIGLFDAGTLRSRVRRRRWRSSHTGDDSPRLLRQHRAILRHHYGELRRGFPTMALAGTS